MKRLVALLPVMIALQAGVQPALAWTWPVDGPVLRPFHLGEDPYAAGQHRGVDLAAPAGGRVRAPAAGRVSFSGTVPGGGLTLTIRTADGFSVTLLHLGSVAAQRDAAVGEGEPVGTVGPSGSPENDVPYVHLGVRLLAGEHAYLDPLSLLPAGAAEEDDAPPAQAPQTVQPPSPSSEGEEAAGVSPPNGPKQTGSSPESAHAASRVKVGPKPHPPSSAKVPTGARTRSHQGRNLDGSRATAPSPSVVAALPSPPGSRAQAVDRGRSGGRATRPRGRAVTPLAASGRATRTRRESFELPVSAGTAARPRTAAPQTARRTRSVVWAGAAASLCVLVATACGLAVRRRQLVDARPANRPAAVFLDHAPAAAEDAGLLRPAEEDRVLLDRDLERILLEQSESLADLDRNHDPAQVVQVADDPRRTRSSLRAQCRAHRSNPPRRLVSNRRSSPVSPWPF